MRRRGPPLRSAAGRTRARASPGPRPAAGVTLRCPSSVSCIDEPSQEAQPLGHRVVVAHHASGGDQRFGQQGVAVRQPILRPRPSLVGRAAGERGQTVGHQGAGGVAPLVGRQEIGCSHHGVRGRARVPRAERRDLLEETTGLATDMRPAGGGSRDADPEDRSTVRVVRRRVLRPPTVEPHPQAERPSALVRLHQERQPSFRERLRDRFVRADGDDEPSTGVVGAVAERTMRQRADRMLEDAGVVRHALQVSERGLRQGHAAASRSANTRCASRRYSSPMFGHARRSASSSAWARIDPASASSVSSRRRAFEIDSGSS